MIKKSILPFILALIVSQLAACDSGINGQIDKCVQAFITRGEPYTDSKQRAGVEVMGRIACLRAASGKE